MFSRLAPADPNRTREDRLISVERLSGTSQGDILTGSKNADELIGGDGADRIDGREGDDIVSGGADEDVVIGGAGRDTVDGGPGLDQFPAGSGGDKLVARDGAAEVLTCVKDDAVIDDLADRILGATACGDVATAARSHVLDTVLTRRALVAGRDRGVMVAVRCPKDKAEACSGTLVLRVGTDGARTGALHAPATPRDARAADAVASRAGPRPRAHRHARSGREGRRRPPAQRDLARAVGVARRLHPPFGGPILDCNPVAGVSSRRACARRRRVDGGPHGLLGGPGVAGRAGPGLAPYIHAIQCCPHVYEAAQLPDHRGRGHPGDAGLQPAQPRRQRLGGLLRASSSSSTRRRSSASTPTQRKGSARPTRCSTSAAAATTLSNQPLYALEGTKLLGTGPDAAIYSVRGNPAQGFTFKLPGDDAHGTLKMQAVVIPVGVVLFSSDSKCSGCPGSDSVTLKNITFTNTGTVRFHQVQLLNKDAGETSLDVTPGDVYDTTKAMMPIGDGDMLTNHGNFDFSLDASFIASATTLGDLISNCKNTVEDPSTCNDPVGKADQVNAATTLVLDSQKYADNEQKCVGDPASQKNCADVLVAMDDSFPNGLDSGGLLLSPTRPALDIVNTNDPRDIAHEIGHAIGRQHTKGCTADNQDPAWPDDFGYLEGIGLDPRSGSGDAYGAPYRSLASQVDSGYGDPNASRTSALFNPAALVRRDVVLHAGDVRGLMPEQAYWIAPLGWDEEVSVLSQFAAPTAARGAPSPSPRRASRA